MRIDWFWSSRLGRFQLTEGVFRESGHLTRVAQIQQSQFYSKQQGLPSVDLPFQVSETPKAIRNRKSAELVSALHIRLSEASSVAGPFLRCAIGARYRGATPLQILSVGM